MLYITSCFSFILYLVVCASYSASPILPLPSLPLLTTSLFFIQEPQVWVKSLPNWLQKMTTKVQFSSVAQLCLTLCDPMNCSTPGLPVHHQLPEFTQTHVHRVRDAIQPSHPLLSPSPTAPNPSQHQSLLQ